jgi:putative ABC transport system ATP-binding protein
MKPMERTVPEFVQVENLTRGYLQGGQRQLVLDHVAFGLRRGEIVALLGRSGSGKSTLLNLLSGIDLADSGKVLFEAKDLTGLAEQQRTLFRRRHIGFIYQFFNLVPSLTAAENIALVAELNGATAADALQRAEQSLAQVGLGDKGARYPAELSGGEQQRVAILRALIHEPALVLADEPTGNLDAESGQQMLELLTNLARTRHCAVLLVTHSLAVAQAADRILTLEKGRIEERSGDFAW